ncbi:MULTISPECIES: CheR family methyltransferase [Roseomonadaceae]|uniref:histidine kinase n=1 Tax=Falsiroseomonas oleicola TaxID=2801474 RepID=A0ABS6HHS8_9PROT|nr:CheR family methyltransferase [Roseomonas oleicola]MBU8546820.1 PAS domain-containing protein [Roseomonas oleicola]
MTYAVARFPIVGIGASAGGVEALQSFFRAMKQPSPMAFIVVTHLARGRLSALPGILADCTDQPIIPAEDDQKVEPGHTYVLQQNAIITIEGGRIVLRPQPAERRREHHPIDVFLSSLAEDQQHGAIGVVLSGSGSDGTLGLKAIKTAGGLTMVQGSNGTSPQYDDMPHSAIGAGVVDLVVPAEHMLARLAELAEGFDDPSREQLSGAASAAAHATIAGILMASVGHDFSGYKDRTFFRRVHRRIHVLRLPSLEAYIAKLRADPEEARRLFQDLLIGVTSFYRDPAAFTVLAERVIPRLFEGHRPDEAVRIWVPGCSTGEEAYSLAILLREHMDANPGGPRAQIFATDIDEAALAVARRGRYPAALLASLTPARLARHFVEDGACFAVAKPLRDLCVFSAHNLINDPPFSRIDLISCRNLMIYLGTALQDRVIPLFHYALRPGGFLFLGIAETIARHADHFTADDKAHRIYRRRDAIAAGGPALRLLAHAPGTARIWPPRIAARPVAGARGTELRQAVEALVLDQFAPPHVVVNRDGDVLHQSAHLGRYLEPATGRPSRQLLAMARPGLRFVLRAALREAIETQARVIRPLVEIEVEQLRISISLTITPLPMPLPMPEAADRLFMVVFTEIPAAPQALVRPDAPLEQGGTQRLERELRDTRERLQSTSEEYETATEELTSANEEMVSVNEELQSTNEELETSKEELQSVNEELRAANTELSSKIDELDRANGDLRNLFDSTQIATLFLDRHLVIRSFTPAVTSIFNLVAADRGRPVTDFASQLDKVNLRRETRQVLDERETVERRVTARDGQVHYLMRLLPYRTAEGLVDGVVLTFFDVTKVVEGEILGTLVDELNHRVRNMLQVVQAVASITLRRTGSLDEFRASFGGRIKALARAHELLADQGWTTVDLEALVTKEVSPHVDGADRVTLSGAAVALRPKVALTLGMVLHELVTNAVKHGALSVPRGVVRVGWKVEGVAPAAMLRITWTESGGPATVPAQGEQRRGFGTELMGRLLHHDLGGEVKVVLGDGVRVTTLDLPLNGEPVPALHALAGPHAPGAKTNGAGGPRETEPRFRTHNQNNMTAAKAHAERKMSGHRS